MKTDAKIDLMHRSGFVGRTPVKGAGLILQSAARSDRKTLVKDIYRGSLDEVEEKDVEMSLVSM
jgi:hypothetical protein